MNDAAYGKIIFLNGTSSSGKTTLAKGLRPEMDEPFCYYASDQLADAGFRSRRPYSQLPAERDRFFDGFHRSIAAFAFAGNNMIVEHILEERSWAEDVNALLAPFRVLWVGVHAPADELVRRELQRGDRTAGESLFHLKTHRYCQYDLQVDSMLPLPEQVNRIRTAWRTKWLTTPE